MKAKKILSAITALTMLPAAGAVTLPVTVSAASATTVRLDPSNASPFNNGEFQGWGTSLCWWANRLGYSESLTKQAADAFFSDEGLGLDIARYNIGGGDDPTHNHITRSDSKIPGYWSSYTLSEDGKNVNITYDWTQDENQRSIALAALAANPELYVEGFSNSPPYFMTNSGCSSGAENSGNDNLNPDMYDDFADYIATTTKYFKDNFGITFQSYSPMNEPDTTYWGALSPKQEGCHYSPGDTQSNTIIATRKALDEKGLTDVLVAGMDETSINTTITNYGKLSAEAQNALGRIDTHTYSGSNRAGLKSTAIAAGKDLWMSEVDGGWDGFGLADRIILDMNGMQPAAWVMWDIVDLHKDSSFQAPDGTYSEKNNELNVTGSLWGIGMADHDTETLYLANKYYMFGQFTRYINPGDTIIASSNSTLAAYNKESGDIKIVVSNSSSSDKNYIFDLSPFTNTGTEVTEIRSNNLTGSAAEHWAEITGEAELEGGKLVTTAKAATVTTYVISGDGPTDYAVISGGSGQISLGSTVNLTLNTNIDPSGGIIWTVSDPQTASISADGASCAVSAKNSGTVTVSATVAGFTVSQDFEIPLYTVTGTPSWSSGTTAPSDDTDYLKAVDGDLSTGFDGLQGGWVQYDYGTPFKLTAVKLAARSGSSAYLARTVGGMVQASNDGISWTTLYTISSAIAADTYTTIDASSLADNHAYRYYRYTNNENMTNIGEFLLEGAISDDIPSGDPVITDLAEFTDNFEGASNIFGAEEGALGSGSQTYASGLSRFGYVYIPAKATAVSTLAEPVELTARDKFRMTFDMFSGWESNGKANTFAILDKNGNEIAALYLTGGGYNFSEIRIGGENVLPAATVSQCKSNASGSASKLGANGWDSADQPYRNYVGYNKAVEITIDGTGVVSISAAGGMEDTTVTGSLSTPVSIGSISITGDYNSAPGRTVSYDNLNGDIITYSEELATPAPTESPTPEPAPTDPPVLPEDGTLISLDFENGLQSGSAYGAASGSPKYITEDGNTYAQLDGTAATVIKLTDCNGNSLLTGLDEFTISFRMKPATTSTSWWFFAAPDDTAQTYLKEQYIGAFSNSGTLTVERYNNSGARSTAAAGSCSSDNWNDVMISVAAGKTTLYINGSEVSTVDSTVDISDMLGTSSVAYIGLANWGSGEFATGCIDDFIITTGSKSNPLGSIDLGDTTAVTDNITIPSAEGVVWTTSDASIVTADGQVTRADETKTAVLTASTTADGVEYARSFTITVIGKAAYADSFTAYAENGLILFTSDYTPDDYYDFYVAVHNTDGTLAAVKKNIGSGSFDNLENGTYKVSCYVWDDRPKHDVITRTVKLAEEQEMGAYLFAHFAGNETSASHEQIYFSVSQDGTTWTTLNGGAPILTSDVGEKGVRDPYILRGEDGKFFIIATDLSIYYLGSTQGSNKWGYCQTNGSQSIVIWESDDLVNWSEANLVKVAKDNAGCTWAPEAVYDAEKGAYMVFWASKTSDDNYATQRMYRSYTTDFKTFTEPEIYIDGGTVSNIDTTITSYKGVYYRFTKNESRSSVTMMKAFSLDGPWTDVQTYTLDGAAGDSVTGYEGPAIYKVNGEDRWVLLLDAYASGKGYVPYVTDDITAGAFTKTSFSFDATYRHGTVIPITTEEYNALIAAY